MLKEPDVLGWPALFKEQEIGIDAGVGSEDALGQAHDGVEVELFEQLVLSVVFTPSPKRKPSGSTTAARPVSCLSRCMMSAMKRSAVSRVCA